MSGYGKHYKEGQRKVKEVEGDGNPFLQRLGKACLKMWFKQRLEGRKGVNPRDIWGQNFPGRGNDKVRGIKVGASLVDWRRARRPESLAWSGQRRQVRESMVTAEEMAPVGGFEQTGDMIFLIF